jgi:DNA mismatch repair protein MutS
MAGLPEAVLTRAREILNSLESHSLTVTDSDMVMDRPNTVSAKGSTKQWAPSIPSQEPIPQLTLFESESDLTAHAVIDKLKASDVDRMTPLEALMLLSELRRSLF